jgi:hypothetical protein
MGSPGRIMGIHYPLWRNHRGTINKMDRPTSQQGLHYSTLSMYPLATVVDEYTVRLMVDTVNSIIKRD